MDLNPGLAALTREHRAALAATLYTLANTAENLAGARALAQDIRTDARLIEWLLRELGTAVQGEHPNVPRIVAALAELPGKVR